MSFYILQDNIFLQSRDELLEAHVYMQFKKHNTIFSESDIKIIVELYKMEGYKNKKEQDEFFDICLSKGLKTAKQSLRNTLSDYTKAGFLTKPKNLHRFVSESFIPKTDAKQLGAIYKISYASNE
jgi:hypothetical protein